MKNNNKLKTAVGILGLVSMLTMVGCGGDAGTINIVQNQGDGAPVVGNIDQQKTPVDVDKNTTSTKQPIAETPVTKQPVTKQPVVETPVTETSSIYVDSTKSAPVYVEPIVSEPGDPEGVMTTGLAELKYGETGHVSWQCKGQTNRECGVNATRIHDNKPIDSRYEKIKFSYALDKDNKGYVFVDKNLSEIRGYLIEIGNLNSPSESDNMILNDHFICDNNVEQNCITNFVRYHHLEVSIRNERAYINVTLYNGKLVYDPYMVTTDDLDHLRLAYRVDMDENNGVTNVLLRDGVNGYYRLKTPRISPLQPAAATFEEMLEAALLEMK